MSLEMAMIAAHVPSICHEEQAPDFQFELVEALHEMRDKIEKLNIEAIVLMSCHFPATFHHYVDAAREHAGILTAVECPDLIANVPYRHAGDEVLGSLLAAAGQQAGIPVIPVDDPTHVWDYGTVVPLRYLTPSGSIPVVSLSVCWAASLDESYRWGEAIGSVLREYGKRTVFISSGALSHNLVRGRHNMPTRSEQAMDKQFIAYLLSAEYESAREMLNQYARIAGVESGGRHLAALLGVLGDEKRRAELWGYGQSSGSGNVVMSFVS